MKNTSPSFDMRGNAGSESIDVPKPVGTAVPIGPFMSRVFGDSLNTAEGRAAAVAFMQSNQEQFNKLFSDYVQEFRAKASRNE